MTCTAAVLMLLSAAPPLKVIVRADADEFLEPQNSPVTQELELLGLFAHAHHRELQVVTVETVAELIPALLDGKGDVVADGLTVTPQRKKQVAFTRPTRTVREMVVTLGKISSPPVDVAALKGRAVVVPQGSAYADTLRGLDGVTVVEKEGAASPDALLFQLTRGAFDLTVLDDARIESMRAYLPELTPLFPVGERDVAFALRPSDKALRSQLDAFLIEHSFRRAEAGEVGDLDVIKKRGTLRVLVRNNAVSFYLYKGSRDGFDYELAKTFARSLGLFVEVIVAPSYDALLPMLKEGKGDVVAASLTVTPERQKEVAFSRPYLKVSELFVQKKGAPALTSLEALRGRTVTVRPSSSYAEKLRPLTAQYGFTLADAKETEEVEDLLADVDEGRVELTVADSHFFQAEALFRPSLEAPLKLSGDTEADIAFAVRTENIKLRAALDAFVKKHYRSMEYNMLKKRSFENRGAIAQGRQSSAKSGSLSPYDKVIRRYSEQYSFDWRLMSAQAWRESRFDPNAKSFVGALGLFQVMPATGKELGFTKLQQPDQGVHAGVKYMHQLLNRFDASLPLDERVRFSLAAYNAGMGRVQDARRLAEDLKLDPDVWAGNVEKAMGLLAQPRYARRSRHGFCRCQEPVDYVRSIEDKYASFVQLVQ